LKNWKSEYSLQTHIEHHLYLSIIMKCSSWSTERLIFVVALNIPTQCAYFGESRWITALVEGKPLFELCEKILAVEAFGIFNAVTASIRWCIGMIWSLGRQVARQTLGDFHWGYSTRMKPEEMNLKFIEVMSHCHTVSCWLCNAVSPCNHLDTANNQLSTRRPRDAVNWSVTWLSAQSGCHKCHALLGTCHHISAG